MDEDKKEVEKFLPEWYVEVKTQMRKQNAKFKKTTKK